MPTYYVEDYDGERNADAVDPLVLTPVVEAKVVAAPESKPAKKATAKPSTKSKSKG